MLFPPDGAVYVVPTPSEKNKNKPAPFVVSQVPLVSPGIGILIDVHVFAVEIEYVKA